MHRDVLEAIDMIDSAFFTGDSFMSEEGLDLIEEKLRIWGKEAASNREILLENAEIEEDEDEEEDEEPTERSSTGLEPGWAKKLTRRTIAALVEAVGGDGHTIFKPGLFERLGVPGEVVRHFTVNHRGGDAPKDIIFDRSLPVPNMTGVYAFDFMRSMAQSLGIGWRHAFGRGTEARAVASAIRLWLEETDPKRADSK